MRAFHLLLEVFNCEFNRPGSPAWRSPQGTYYGLSEKGWIDRELFKAWLGRHFLTNAVAGHSLLLLLDGLSSHYEPESLKYAKENDVIMFALPPLSCLASALRRLSDSR